MKIVLVFYFLIMPILLSAQSCDDLKVRFEKEESAYDTVARIAIAGNSAYKVIGAFIKEGETVLKQCPKSYSLDRQYTLKRKIVKAKRHKESYRVFSQSQLSQYARTHPEEIVIYKWGTIRSVP